MTMSARKQFLTEILGNDPIPLGKLAYFRERFRDHLYELVLEEFIKSKMTKAELARRISRKPEQVTRWLGAPGNWEIDTASDMLLAISKAEPRVSLDPLEDRRATNFTKPEWQTAVEDDVKLDDEITAAKARATRTETRTASVG